MKIPARCNKRHCQTRRNLSKRPQLYKTWPTCNMPGCDGKMYVDEYRLRGGPKDRAPLCRSDCRPYNHTYDDKDCKHHADWVLERSMNPSKHNPHQNLDQPHEAPF